MTKKPRKYRTRLFALKMTPTVVKFIRRRIDPFLDTVGMQKPLSVLMMEAYMLGMSDTLDILKNMEMTKDEAPAGRADGALSDMDILAQGGQDDNSKDAQEPRKRRTSKTSGQDGGTEGVH